MLEIKNVEVHGLERSMIASGNPMTVGEIQTAGYEGAPLVPPILERGQRLGSSKAGSGHDNFLKGIIVQFDVKYPQYWTPEYQRYKFESIISSQSKMHRLGTMSRSPDFEKMFNSSVDPAIIAAVKNYCNMWQDAAPEDKYHWFMKALSNLPSGFEMWMSCSSNYLSLKTIVSQRYNHKLNEWRIFCKWALGLPMFGELTGFDKEVHLLE